MIVAKETAAAVNHSDEYVPYTSLLATNSLGLQNVLGRALGATAAAQFAKVWDQQNGLLVDYAIGVVTHDDDKTNTTTAKLSGPFVLDFAQMIEGLAGLPAVSVTQMTTEQIVEIKACIDDQAAGKFASFYADVQRAYEQASQLGDALAADIAVRAPDRYPGAVHAQPVDARVELNLQLQEQAYLATMATDAAVANRTSEKAAATSALASSGAGLDKTWPAWDSALVGYAAGAELEPATFVDRLTLATGASKTSVQYLVQAMVRVVDDQKTRSSKTLADDDRIAATAMQPIADSIS